MVDMRRRRTSVKISPPTYIKNNRETWKVSMGEFAGAVQEYLHKSLSEKHSSIDWHTEYDIGGTPVDLAGEALDHVYLIELEWRRADPADNAAKIFRHLNTNSIEVTQVTVLQVFTQYYDLKRGGVNSKRKNAEFVGSVAADTYEELSYTPILFPLDPPKRGAEWPSDWQDITDTVVSDISHSMVLDQF